MIFYQRDDAANAELKEITDPQFLKMCKQEYRLKFMHDIKTGNEM